MHVDIITPDKNLFSGEADVVTLPGTDGSFQILKNHAPLISNLAKGVVVLKSKEGIQQFEVEGGVVEVLKNKITILA